MEPLEQFPICHCLPNVLSNLRKHTNDTSHAINQLKIRITSEMDTSKALLLSCNWNCSKIYKTDHIAECAHEHASTHRLGIYSQAYKSSRQRTTNYQLLVDLVISLISLYSELGSRNYKICLISTLFVGNSCYDSWKHAHKIQITEC